MIFMKVMVKIKLLILFHRNNVHHGVTQSKKAQSFTEYFYSFIVKLCGK